MPELPEVETMRRGLLPTVGSRIRRVDVAPCRLKPIRILPQLPAFSRRVTGQRIDDLQRLGKRVVLRLANGDSIVFEPRMTGLLLIADPPNQEHLRFGLRLVQGPIPTVWYWDRRGLGSVRLFTERELQAALGPSRLGPDALDLDADVLTRRLGNCQREIKVALLDQRVVAGIGNLYASEILHVARIHPQTKCHRMTPRRWQRLHRALRKVLLAAIRYEGSTLGDGTYRNALNRNGTYQNHHRVYKREGRTCLSCRQRSVRRFVQAQRSTFFCPRCQR